jgi:hypothetical protein
MITGINTLSVIAIRKEPSDKSEMVSQLLFGEMYLVIEKNDKWLYIETIFDRYRGYIDAKHFVNANDKEYYNYINSLTLINSDLFSIIINLKSHTRQYIPAGSNIPEIKRLHNTFFIGNENFKIKKCNLTKPYKKDRNFIINTAKRFLNTPYLWGGRTFMGIDCSGFTQLVYKISGFSLPRDAYLQAQAGTNISSVEKASAGDLLFFKNNEEKIVHVGIYMGKNQIIHSSGMVKIEKVDDTGIWNNAINNYSHKLVSIKSFI